MSSHHLFSTSEPGGIRVVDRGDWPAKRVRYLFNLLPRSEIGKPLLLC